MLEVLVIVTFLLTSGTKSEVKVYPPGGDYHARFAASCEINKPKVVEQIRKMLVEKKIDQPADSDKVFSIKVYCIPADTKA